MKKDTTKIFSIVITSIVGILLILGIFNIVKVYKVDNESIPEVVSSIDDTRNEAKKLNDETNKKMNDNDSLTQEKIDNVKKNVNSNYSKTNSKLEEVKENDNSNSKFVKDIVYGVLSNHEVLDNMINKYLDGWKISRLGNIDQVIFRMSVYELIYTKEIDKANQVYKRDGKQIFFLDDYWGSSFKDKNYSHIENTKFINFVDKISKTNNKILVITSRDYIIKQVDNDLKRILGNKEYLLDIKKISLNLRYKILYKYLSTSNINYSYIEYILENCAYGCKYFILEKIN